MRIYLVGYMGSGKSTLGRDLSEAMGVSWIDCDDEFESRFKISIASFFQKYGEDAFRELEHKILTDISLTNNIVVSTGGGAPCFKGNMQLMNTSGITVYLEAPAEVLYARIRQSYRKRPVFGPMKGKEALQRLKQHLESRQACYKQAQITIDAVNPDIKKLIREISGNNQRING